MKVGIFKRQPQKGANESLLVPPCGKKKTKKKQQRNLPLLFGNRCIVLKVA